MCHDETTHECMYCQSIVPAIDATPAITDDAAWDAIAAHHAANCEWVATRAHFLEADETHAADSYIVRLTEQGVALLTDDNWYRLDNPWRSHAYECYDDNAILLFADPSETEDAKLEASPLVESFEWVATFRLSDGQPSEDVIHEAYKVESSDDTIYALPSTIARQYGA